MCCPPICMHMDGWVDQLIMHEHTIDRDRPIFNPSPCMRNACMYMQLVCIYVYPDRSINDTHVVLDPYKYIYIY